MCRGVKPILMVLVLCTAMTASISLSFAQATTGTITGTITDQTGAVIPGATITVRNIETNITRTSNTAEQGRYIFPGLPIGSYELTFEQPGFTKVVRGPIVLILAQTAVVDQELKAAGVNTETVVTLTED